jgi:hypothetical protein
LASLGGTTSIATGTTPTTSPTGVMSPTISTPSPPSPHETTAAETTAPTTPVVVTPPALLASPSLPSPPVQDSSPSSGPGAVGEHSESVGVDEHSESVGIDEHSGLDDVDEQQSSPSRSCSPRSGTTELSNKHNRVTSEQGLLLEAPKHSRRPPQPAGTFVYNGSSQFITPAAIQYLQTVCAGQRWADMVLSFLCLEELSLIAGVGPINLLRSTHTHSFISLLLASPLSHDRPRLLSG